MRQSDNQLGVNNEEVKERKMAYFVTQSAARVKFKHEVAMISKGDVALSASGSEDDTGEEEDAEDSANDMRADFDEEDDVEEEGVDSTSEGGADVGRRHGVRGNIPRADHLQDLRHVPQ